MRKVALKFLDEESVGSCEERISREEMFKVVEDSLNGGVEAAGRWIESPMNSEL